MALATLCSCTIVKKTSYIAEVQTAEVQYPTVTELDVMDQAICPRGQLYADISIGEFSRCKEV